MASINQIRASDGSGNANVATVQSTRAPLSSTIIVDTVAGIPTSFMGSMGTPHTFVDPITSEQITVISEATAVDFSGHVDGANLEIDSIAPGYTDGGSAIGDIVIIRPTTQYANNVADVLDTIHNDDGTLKANTVNTDQYVDDSIPTAAYQPGSVTSPKLKSTIAYRGFRNAAMNLTGGGGEEKIILDGTTFNVGSHYNATTGTFTAPVRGFYQVSASVRCVDVGANTALLCFIYVNGSPYIFASNYGTAAADDLSSVISALAFLEATQTIELWGDISVTKAISGAGTTMSIHFVGTDL